MPIQSVPNGPCVSKRRSLCWLPVTGTKYSRAKSVVPVASTILLPVSNREGSPVRRAVQAALKGHGHIVLAVSSGLDSMTLLDAAAATLPRECLTVATFDHATGEAATTARRFVETHCAELGLCCVGERSAHAVSSEADLRTARWEFLRAVARERRALVATAHTASDQIETVLMRVLRDAGARGLAGLAARS